MWSLLWTPIGALTSSVVMGTPSSSNSFWKVRTGAKTPASRQSAGILRWLKDGHKSMENPLPP